MKHMMLPTRLVPNLFFILLLFCSTLPPVIPEIPLQTVISNFNYATALIKSIQQTIPELADFHYEGHVMKWKIQDKNAKRLIAFFETEHNLVYAPNRKDEMELFVRGTVPVLGVHNETYIVRLLNREEYEACDIVIEYSQPNIHNIRLANALPPHLIEKIVYVPPMMFPYFKEEVLATSLTAYKQGRLSINDLSSAIRGKDNRRQYLLATTIIKPDFGRRKEILANLSHAGLTVTNFDHHFREEEVKEIYSDIKILLNIHQNDFYHTAEEFRLLPALLRGCVIISEDVPLRETIPYHEYIIWIDGSSSTSFTSALINTILNVVENYEYYYEMIHGAESQLLDILIEMRRKAEEDMKDRLVAILTQRQGRDLS